MAMTMQLLAQLRHLADGDLRRDVALREPDYTAREVVEPGRASPASTLRGVVRDLTGALLVLDRALDEWDTTELPDWPATTRVPTRRAGDHAATAAAAVVHELARLGVIAPEWDDGEPVPVEFAVRRVTTRVRLHPAAAGVDEARLRQLVAAVLSIAGYVRPLPAVTMPLPVVQPTTPPRP